MGISESELPGIGRRYEIDVRDRSRAVAVVHTSGRRDLFAFKPGADEATASVQLDDERARQLGAILGGSYYRPHSVGPVTSIIGRFAIEAVDIPEGSPITGRTILDLELRRRTGVSIVALLEGNRTALDPGPGSVLDAGDVVVVVGTEAALAEFRRMVLGTDPDGRMEAPR